ncbi:hypothetical protein BTE56_22450, partial [Agrobacterium pusense]
MIFMERRQGGFENRAMPPVSVRLHAQPRTSDARSASSEEFRNAALDLIRERYLDFGPTLARE